MAAPAVSSLEVPEKAKEEARAKADLVSIWHGYRETSRQGRQLAEVDRIFEVAYNTGHLLPALFAKLGPVDIKSIYRYAKKLEEGDWTALVPAWHFGHGEPGLTVPEKTVFLDCLLQPNRLNIGEGIRVSKAVLKQRGIPSPSSPMTFRRFAEHYKAKNGHVWTLLREGEKALKDTQIFSIKRDPSKLEVGQVLVGDGHRLNFQVKNPFPHGRPCRATLVGYLDWRSADLAGFDIMLEENTELIASALRRAIIRLGKTPEYVLQDNGSAFRGKFFTSTDDLRQVGLSGLFGRLNIVPLFAAPYNARSKPIERFFKEFAKFERLLLSFTGTSIGDKPAWMRRNEKFHRALHSGDLPTIEQTVEMVNIWIESYWEEQPHPHIKGKTIGEIFNGGKGPGVDVAALDDLMLAHEVKTIGPRGIRFLNADYYDDALFGLREKAIVKYSIADLTSVRVYDMEGHPLCTAKRFDAVDGFAAQLGSAKDLAEVRHLQNKQKSLMKATMRVAMETKELLHEQKKALPWADIIEAVPRVVERLEKANIELPAYKEQIPEEAVRHEPALLTGAQPDAMETPVPPPSVEKPVRPSFHSDTDKYLWLAEHGPEEGDEEWIEGFKASDSYRLLRAHLDAMERKYAEARSRKETKQPAIGGTIRGL
jgi:putative transposase